jgi:hypothetical protein
MWSCKLIEYFQFASLQISAWLLVLLSLDRFLSVRIKTWKSVHFKPKRAVIAASFLAGFFIFLNAHALVLFGHSSTPPLQSENQTTNNNTSADVITIQCYTIDDEPTTYWMATWNLVHSFLYSYVPFVLLTITNVCLLISISKSNNRNNMITINANRPVSMIAMNSPFAAVVAPRVTTKSSKEKSLTIMVIAMTLIFICMTCPGAIGSIYYDSLIQTEFGTLVLYLLDALTFSYHGFNIFILILTNKKFRCEFKEMFCQFGGGSRIQIQNRRRRVITISMSPPKSLEDNQSHAKF